MSLNEKIDHTILKANCTKAQIQQICEEAITHHFRAVCIPPFFVKEAAHLLQNSPVMVATVVGFPMGYSSTPAKVEEIKRAIDEGADELDVVVNICAIKSQNWNYVKNDIESMTMAAHLKGKIIKVIFEIDLLSNEEIEKLCEICTESAVDFVKTSTGFNGDATIENISLLKNLLPDSIKIKASGGIRNAASANKMLEAGAHRIGSSSGIQIIQNQ